MNQASQILKSAKTFFFDKIYKRIDHKILVYLVFVAISSVFWLLNELSNNFTTTIKYPVKFTNMPKDKVLVTDLPHTLSLNVKAYGFTLLRYKLTPVAYPVVIDMGSYKTLISSKNKIVLHTKHLRETITGQLSNSIEVFDIMPDTISFTFAELVTKRIPVKPDVKLFFNDECMLDGNIRFHPDSITVNGPNVIVDTLKAVYNKFHVFKNLSKPVERTISLKPINKVSFNTRKVKIELPVSKFTQFTVKVNILSTNVPDSLELKTFPRKASISGVVSLSNFDKIDSDEFTISADYNEIEKLIGDKLPLHLTYAPSIVQNITFTPQNVEFLLEQKQ